MIIGHVGQEPMIRYTSDNNKIAKFTVATTERYRDKEGRPVENTDWHNVECWGGRADLVEKAIHKGTLVYIEGKSKTSTYNKDGATVTKSYIAPEDIQILERKPSTPGAADDLPE